MTYESNAKGIDVSFWQGQNDWQKIAGKVDFAFIRAGQGIYPDTKFNDNWNQSGNKLLRGAYWFYDWRTGKGTPEQQAEKFLETVVTPGELPFVMDFENPYGGWANTPVPSKTTAFNYIQKFRDALKVERMIVYTNPAMLKLWTPLPYWLMQDYELWVANYPYASGTTRQVKTHEEIPDGWQPSTYGWKWKFWQYTSKLPGFDYGVGSGDLDGDLFNGTKAELLEYAGIVPPVVPDSEKLKRLWEAHPELH